MQTPIRITYRHMDASTELEARIREHVANLEPCCDHIVGCHVHVELPKGPRAARTYEVNIDLTVPGSQIAVHSGRANRVAHTDVNAALNDAFAMLKRLLQEYVPYSAVLSREASQDPACS